MSGKTRSNPKLAKTVSIKPLGSFMTQGSLYYAVGWTVICAFAITLFITIAALIGLVHIDEFYLKALFVKLILEVVAAGFFYSTVVLESN